MLYKLGILLYYKIKNNKNFTLSNVLEKFKIHLIIYTILIAVLIYLEETVYGHECVCLFMAYLIYRSPEIVSSFELLLILVNIKK